MDTNTHTRNALHHYTYYALLLTLVLATLIPWALTYFNLAINVDIAFLALSAERLLNGEMMSVSYYDTNPPLSILLYTPAAFLTGLSSIPLYITTILCSGFYLLISTCCTYALLKKLPWTQHDPQKRHLILITYLFANTVAVNHDFGQRDHILGMALFPFVLAQILITLKISFSGWSKWTSLIFGSITLLLKPHYGLIPVAILLFRMAYQRRFWIIKDADFLCLATTTLSYLAIIFLFFHDFISVILPDILQFYTDTFSKYVIEPTIKTGALALFIIFVPQFMPKQDNYILILGLIGLLCVVGLFLQGKGFAYHDIPAKIFLSSAVTLFLYNLITEHPKYKLPTKAATIALSILALAIMNMLSIHLDKRPTHTEYKNLELTKVLNECDGACSFFMFNDQINLIHELSVYANQPHASRFPVLWFLPHLINHENKTGNKNFKDQTFEFYKEKYLTLILDDFKRYQPDTLIIVDTYFTTKTAFDFIEFTQEKDPSFIDIWANYEYEKTVKVEMNDYIGVKTKTHNTSDVYIYKKIQQ